MEEAPRGGFNNMAAFNNMADNNGAGFGNFTDEMPPASAQAGFNAEAWEQFGEGGKRPRYPNEVFGRGGGSAGGFGRGGSSAR